MSPPVRVTWTESMQPPMDSPMLGDFTAEELDVGRARRRGAVITAIHSVMRGTMLIVACDDGAVREVPARDVAVEGSERDVED